MSDFKNNPSDLQNSVPSLSDLMEKRFSRRSVLNTLGIAGLTVATSPLMSSVSFAQPTGQDNAPVKVLFPCFTAVKRTVSKTHEVAPDHQVQVLLRWGDALFTDSPKFDPHHQTPESQSRQFGYNNDFIGFVSLPKGSQTPDHGILCVNHESVDEEMMFPHYYTSLDGEKHRRLTETECRTQMEAVGNSLIEIRKDENQQWTPIINSPLNRRISLTTPMDISGPASGHDRLKTNYDETGKKLIGTTCNCSGGITPWGTYLTCEENIDKMFRGTPVPAFHTEHENHKSFEIPSPKNRPWGLYEKRFDIDNEPNEPNRFGWVVEIDPYDPVKRPIKRTALGRMKHEACNIRISSKGKVIAYMGDDQDHEHIYKFISSDSFDPSNSESNKTLLDKGTLYTAKFYEDGRYEWLPLVYGKGELTPKNGFHNQGDVVIEARRAARLSGATPMDRPEDVEPHPITGRVYVSLTNNKTREQADPANPRFPNPYGHILEMIEEGDNAEALTGKWDILLFGQPEKDDKKAEGGLCCPDNLALDGTGNLWVTTDQGDKWQKTSGYCDGLWCVSLEKDSRGQAYQFFRVPVGAECTGPFFTPDYTSLFLSVQHPAADGVQGIQGFSGATSFDNPITRWPDFDPKLPPRPSVVVCKRTDNKPIG